MRRKIRTGDKDNKIMTKFKIGVLAGGPSSEREISLKSGKAVYNALREGGLNAIFIDVCDNIQEELNKIKTDVVFILLHGGAGEDGTVQKMLEDLKIPYTGSGPEASRLAMDKLASRIIFERIGIDVPKYKVLQNGKDSGIDGLNTPLVIKPQKEGSSVGLSIVSDLKDLDSALDKAFSYGENILVEEFIKGREITVGVLDEEPLPVVEIKTENGCYDYRAKYESPKTEYLVPALIEQRYFRKAQGLGLKAYQALGCRSFSRVDMILGDDGKIYVLEVNTIPGLTSRSLLPKAAEAAGIDFCNLCKKILEGALR